jgi:hypothetical protein
MWRSAESRVRESSEGGRIGPDLDLTPLLYPPPREAKAHSLAAEARHAALDPRPASRATHARFVLRLLWQDRARRTATFHRSFPVCPLPSPSIFAPVLDHRGRWCDVYGKVGRAATSLVRTRTVISQPKKRPGRHKNHTKAPPNSPPPQPPSAPEPANQPTPARRNP